MPGPTPGLPEASPRRLIHRRRVVTEGYLRDDGLWDIDGELFDEKTYVYADRERGALPPGSPMHHMLARITIDNDMVVHDARVGTPALPFAYCATAMSGVPQLAGTSVGSGWRRAVDAAMGGTRGCTHMRELFYALATTAFQTISAYREQHMPELGAPRSPHGAAPFFLDQCHTWERSSPVVAQYLPKFHRKP